MEVIVLGGGCFWCVEGAIKGLRGVSEVIPGYSGGHLENPTYEQVCAKNTGHAEVVKVTFDPAWKPEMMTDEAKEKLGFYPTPAPSEKIESNEWE